MAEGAAAQQVKARWSDVESFLQRSRIQWNSNWIQFDMENWIWNTAFVRRRYNIEQINCISLQVLVSTSWRKLVQDTTEALQEAQEALKQAVNAKLSSRNLKLTRV